MRRFWRGRVASVACITVVLTVAGPVLAGCTPVTVATELGRDDRRTAGVATGWQTLWASDADQAADYAGVAASGASWTTLDIDWNHIQDGGPLVVQLERRHRPGGAAASAHDCRSSASRATARPGRAGRTARRGSCTASRPNPADYGRFLGAAAARYGSRSPDLRLRGTIEVWSLWNEPNHQPYSMPRPDPDKYAAMVKSAYAAIKAADPDATVLTGGTAPAPDAADGSDYQPTTWLRMLYDRGAGGSFDGVASHPYAYPFSPLTDKDWNAYRQTEYLHDVMAAARRRREEGVGHRDGCADRDAAPRTSPRPARPRRSATTTRGGGTAGSGRSPAR